MKSAGSGNLRHVNRIPGELFGQTHMLDLYSKASNVTPDQLIGCKCCINTALSFLCVSDVSYANLLESGRHLGNRDFTFLAVYFSAGIYRTAACKTRYTWFQRQRAQIKNMFCLEKTSTPASFYSATIH